MWSFIPMTGRPGATSGVCLFIHFLGVLLSFRGIQGLPEAAAHRLLLELVHGAQVLDRGLCPPASLRATGGRDQATPGEGSEDREEALHPEQTLPETAQTQPPERKVQVTLLASPGLGWNVHVLRPA